MENVEKIKCHICGFEGMNLITHIKFKHKITSAQYREKYGNCRLYIHSEEVKQKISKILKLKFEDKNLRKKLSDIQKNGSSIFTKKYWIKKGLTEQEAQIKVSDIQRKNCKKHLEKNNLKECSHFSKLYWLKRGFTESQSIEKVSKIQSELSSRSPKFLGHKRTDEQKIKISLSMKKLIDRVGKSKWAKHFGEVNGRSKIEFSCFKFIKENIESKLKANQYINNYIVDMVVNKKVIEFYGDYWHANPRLFSSEDKMYKDNGKILSASDIWEKDSLRIKNIEKLGYRTLIIWEGDWIKNKNECVEKIKNFIQI